MNAKKNLFGYKESLFRLTNQVTSDWFEPSCFLVQSETVLPEEETEKPFYWWGRIVVILIAAVFATRLMNLQITQGQQNQYLAEGNRLRRQITIAPRGIIVDKNGTPLVTNVPGYTLDMVPSELPTKKDSRDEVLAHVAVETKVPLNDIKKAVQQAGLTSLDPITLQDGLTREAAVAYKVRLSNVPGVRVSYQPARQYDTTPGLSHLLGYTGRMNESELKRHPDYPKNAPIGKSGIESSYDTMLRGDDGVVEMEVDATGRAQQTVSEIPPKVGQTLRLTLDKGLQQEMQSALAEAMQKNDAHQAVGMAINPQNGGILASVSLPAYDNNQFAGGITPDAYKALSSNPDKPLLNRAIDGQYPAGSTIKPFVAAAALQEGTIKANTSLDTSAGAIRINQWVFPDWKVHGTTDVKQAIAESNDIFFYALGGGYNQIPGLGVERLKKYLKMFGFGQPTGVDFAGGATGLIPDQEWKKTAKKESWYIGDTYHMAIGQGDLLVTPLQLARGVSAIANGGQLVTPHLVESVEATDTGVTQQVNFPSNRLPLGQDVIQTVQEGMHRTVVSGTGSARSLQSLPFSSAGKTGTAQFGSDKKTHAWYIGYAPFENPQIAVVIIVEGGGEGNAISVPVAARVFQYYMAHK